MTLVTSQVYLEQQQGQESSSNPSNKSFICKRLQEPSRRPKFPRATQVPEYTPVGGNPRFCLRRVDVWASCDLARERVALGQPHASEPARNSAMPKAGNLGIDPTLGYLRVCQSSHVVGPGGADRGRSEFIPHPMFDLSEVGLEGEVLPHLPPTTYRLPAVTHHLPGTNPICFQQHSRLLRVTIFVFYKIPASVRAAGSRSFVFIDIPALVLHFLKLLVFSFPVDGDILS